jgi:hypothetical protein
LNTACKECANAVSQAWRDRNPERAKELAQRHAAKPGTREKNRARQKAIRESDSGKIARAKAAKAERARLSDAYVRATVAQGSGIPASQIPQSLIDSKREQLSLLRLTRQLKQEITNQLENRNGN